MLGSTLEGEGGIRVIVRALSSDPKLWTAYKKSLDLNERLTNPIAGDGARSLLDLSQGNFDRLRQNEPLKVRSGFTPCYPGCHGFNAGETGAYAPPSFGPV